jgi:hypothetical protein
VNFDDYARLDSGFLNQRTGWLNGDFNGDGVVNFDDYLVDRSGVPHTKPTKTACHRQRSPRQTGPSLIARAQFAQIAVGFVSHN